MPSINDVLPEDPLEAEKALIRVVTDAYKKTSAWKDDQDEIAAIEDDIQNISEPGALGHSPEFGKWETLAVAAGIVWEVDEEGFIQVTY